MKSKRNSIDHAEEFYPTNVFETIRFVNRRPFRLHSHLERLTESGRTAGIRVLREKRAQWIRQIRQALRRAPVSEGWVRIAADSRRTRVWVGAPRTLATQIRRSGARVQTVAVTRGLPEAQPAAVKCSNFLTGILGRLESPESDESIHLNRWGQVCEGSVSNLFAVIDGLLCTPASGCGLLQGVTRQAVAELADALGRPMMQMVLTRHDIYNAQEAFLTNSAVGLLPIREIDGRRIGEDCPGPLTKKLQRAYERLVISECN